MHNVIVLICAQFFAAWGQVCMVVLAGIVGAILAPRQSLATLPVAFAVVGVAVTTVPAALAMQRFGRRPVLIGGMLIASIGTLLAAAAINSGSFWLFSAATGVIGCHLAFTAQFRFAAAESVPPDKVSRAIAWIMLGTVGAAIIAPQIAIAVRGWAGAEYAGSFLLLTVTYLCGAICLVWLRDHQHAETATRYSGRALVEIARQPAFLPAVLAGAAGYGVMALIMTATPLSMHVVEGHAVASTAAVIQGHVLAMYLPSLVTGGLVARLGARRMILMGTLLELACILVALSGREAGHYGVALVALGIGWNLLFVAGTTLLTQTYTASERFRVQALNDFTMFGVTAAASLLAGVLMATVGWRGLNLLALLPLLLLFVALYRARAV
ncbi:MAG: MFS transporter [Gammaproteobacteria bacterium]|nr:MFS transporter [Gammaproteobacteria bacterium]